MAEEDAKQWIYAGGLPYELSEGDVICIFSQYGEVLEFTLARDKDSGKSRGFGFLKYEDPRSCELAVDNFNGTTVIGRKIKVSFANNMNAIKVSKPTIVAPTEDSSMPIVESANRRDRDRHRDMDKHRDRRASSSDESPDLKRRVSRRDSDHVNRSNGGDRRDKDRKVRDDDSSIERRHRDDHSDPQRPLIRRDDSPKRRRRRRRRRRKRATSVDRHSKTRTRRSRSLSSEEDHRSHHHHHRHHRRSSPHRSDDSSDRDHHHRRHSRHSRSRHSKRSHRDRSRSRSRSRSLSIDRGVDRRSRVSHSDRSPRGYERRHR